MTLYFLDTGEKRSTKRNEEELKQAKEELLKKATHCDIAIDAIGFTMQEKFGLLNMEEKGQDKQDKK